MNDPFDTDNLPYDLSSDELIFLIRKLHPSAIHGRDFHCAHRVKGSSSERVSTAIIVSWKLEAVPPSPNEIAALATAYGAELAALRNPSSIDVDVERDRRIAAGFVFEGVLFQSRAEDRENIAGAYAAAKDAISMHDAKAGNFGWQRLLDANAPPEFRWIAADNTTHPMDAQTTVRFGYAALNHKQAHILKARAIKDTAPIPADYTDGKYWQ